MEPLLYRMLVACLSIWLVDQILVKLGVSEPPARIIQIVVIILALVFIFVGWALPLGVK